MAEMEGYKGPEKKAEKKTENPEYKARQDLGMSLADDLSHKPEKTERQKVDEVFFQMKEEFLSLGIELPVDFYKSAYYALVSKDKRPPIDMVHQRMSFFFNFAKESPVARTKLHEKEKQLLEIFQFYLLGQDQEAESHAATLISEIEAQILIKDIEETVGLKFNDEQARQILSQLQTRGLIPKEANRYLRQLKKLAPEDFKTITSSKDLLTSNLISLIIAFKEKSRDFAKGQLDITARFTKEYLVNTREIVRNQAAAEKFSKKKSEAALADAVHNIAYYEMNQALANTKSELAMIYLETKNPKNSKDVIANIFQSKNSADIQQKSQQYGLKLPATLSTLQNKESNFEAKSLDEYLSRAAENPETADKKAVSERLEFESDKLIDISNKLVGRIEKESLYFEELSSQYKTISEIPEKTRRRSGLKLNGYLQLLNQHALIQGKLLSIAASYDLLGVRPQKQAGDSETRSWETMVADIRQESANSNQESAKVAKFLQINDYQNLDLNQSSLSQLAITLIQKENSSLDEKYKGVMDNVSRDYENLGGIMDQFSNIQKDPNWAEAHGTKLVRVFKQGSEAFPKILTSINSTRNKFTAMKGDLSAALTKVQQGDSPLLKLHPQLKEVYKTVLQNAIKQVDTVLDDENSPISSVQIEKLKLAQEEFEKARTAFLNQTLKEIGAFVIILASAVAGGIGGAYMISAILKTSSIFILPIGTSLGGVVGSRIGMTITDATGLTEYGKANIWDPKRMGRDFAYGYVFSLGAMLTAKATITTLSVASHSRNAGVAARASSALNTIQKAKALASPFEFKNAKAALAKVGAKFTQEYGEETIEEGAGRINPYLEFFVSVINASDGINTKLSMAGVDSKKVGLSFEANKLTYTTVTPAEFIANLKSQFAGKKGASFDSKINPDGTINLSIYGQTLHQSIAEITIHPSIQTVAADQALESKTDSSKDSAEDTAVFGTPEKITRIRNRVESIIQDILYHDVKVLFFLDRSARPVYWMIKAAWDEKKLGRPMPKVKFLNIGSEKKALLGTDDQPKRSDFSSDASYAKALKDHWGKLNSADYIAKVKKDISPLLTDEGVDAWGNPYKGKVMVIDDISITNVTQRMATEFLEYHFPGVKVFDATLLSRYDEDVFPPLPGGMWTNLPWNRDENKDYTLMSTQDDPGAVVSKPELDQRKRQKGLGLKKEIQKMFQSNPLNHEKIRALSLAERIANIPIRTTATEIANELFENTPKSKNAFLKTLEKFRTIGTYLKSNAKELATIFENKFKDQGVTLGLSGTQIFQAIYETVAEFAGKKVDIQKLNRKFKVGDTAVYPNGRGGMMDVFIKEIDPQTGEVTLRTTDFSGYETKVSAANFLLFNKKRMGYVSEAQMLLSDYKIGDLVDVKINGQIERGKWKIVGHESWNRIKIRSREGNIYIDAKDIVPKKIEPLENGEIPLLKQLFPEGIETSHFEQQNTGNCYLLAFLHSLKRHPIAPTLVARMISPAPGGWNVKFPGEDNIFLSEEELDGKSEWSPKDGWVFKSTVRGQLGDKILVLAHAKWRRNQKPNYVPGQTMIASEGGVATEPMRLFIGEYSSQIYTISVFDYSKTFSEDPKSKKNASDLLDRFSENPKDYILSVAPPVTPTPYTRYVGGEFNSVKYFMDPEYRFVQKHEYSIVAVNAQARTVTIANPHDTKKKEHTISYEEFFQYFSEIEVAKLDPQKIKGVDFMKVPYIDGELNKPLQRTVGAKFDARGKLFIKLGSKAVISSSLEADGSIFLDMSAATGIAGGPIIQPGAELIVGANTIPNMPNTVSGSHVKIKNLGNGEIVITDLNSLNGTIVYKEAKSNNNDMSIRDGNFNEWINPNSPVKFNAKMGISIYLGKQARVHCRLEADGSIFLDMSESTGIAGGPIIQPGAELIVGANTIPNMPNTVSGSHVKIKNLGNGYLVVTDLNSRNGTYITNN